MKLLIVDDEKDLNNVISKRLKRCGYSVDSCFNGMDALDFVYATDYDCIILDIMMPVMDGYEFLTKMRQRQDQTPIIFLTAKDGLQDKVSGLDLGADDYLVKPFEFDELLARIRVATRRLYGATNNELVIDNLVLDISKKKVLRNGTLIELTSKEYEVLEYLMRNEDHILTRQQIQDHVWDFGYEGASNLIDVLIKNIRKKIDIGGAKALIHTKRGLGYVIK